MRFRRWVLWVSPCLVFAAGCGGGGGTSDSLSLIELDKVAPTVTYNTPLNGSSGFGTNSRLTVTFSEPMDKDTLVQAIRLTNPATGATIAIDSIQYDLLNGLATEVSTAAKDLAGNGLVAAYLWTFTTAGNAAGGAASGADTDAPTVSSRWPGPGAAGIPTNARIAMSFSEPMDVSSIGSAFSLEAGNATVAGRIAYVGRVGVFMPDAPLLPSSTYRVMLGRGATDLAGNRLAADYTWTFTTGTSVDRSAPGVRSVTPADGATNVARDTMLSVTFDEPIYPFVYGTIDGVAAEVSIDYAALTASVIATVPLRSAAGYSASVTARDLAGNVAPVPYRWGFVTAP
jgi:Bacterial Ig-like domain